MIKKPLFLLLLMAGTLSVCAQLQTPDDEGFTQAAQLKKINKKAKYGAYLIEKEIEFGTGKGLNNAPVVTALETGNVEMTSMQDKAVVGYLLPYNQFVKLKDYDFEIFYKRNFKSQKYPPEKVSLTDESIFFDDSYGQFYGFRANEMGQRCRFKYQYQYTDARYLTRVFFHSGIPIRKNTIVFKVPSWLNLEIKEENFEGAKIKRTKRTEGDFTVYTYTAEDLNAIHEEPASLARSYYLPHLVITVRTFSTKDQKYNCLSSLDDMYSWYHFLYKKSDNDEASIKGQVDKLVAGKTTDEEKIKSIYYWVQDNIRYIAFEEGYAGFVPQTVQDVYKNKYGDCKGMANLLTEMLKQAGFDAHFAWIGTREIPYDRKEIQSLCVDNHAICVLYLNGKTYFLDGTEKYAPLGKNAYRIQGKNVLVEDGDQYKVEMVPDATIDDNQIHTLANFTLKEDKITGHVKMTFDGETKNYFHYMYNNIPVTKRKDFIKDLIQLGNSNTLATNIKTSDFEDRDIPLVLEGDIEISNQITRVDKTCYTSIDFFSGMFSGYQPEKDRETPIDLDQVFVTSDEITLQLPAGTKVEQMPDSLTVDFNGNKMMAAYAAADGKVTLKKRMELSAPIIYEKDFGGWTAFLDKIKDFNRKSITLETP